MCGRNWNEQWGKREIRGLPKGDVYSCTLTSRWKGASSHLGRTFKRAGMGTVGRAELKVLFYSWHPTGQMTFPHASGGSLRPSCVFEGGNWQDSRERQCLWTAAVFCCRCCGLGTSLSPCPWSKRDTVSVSWLFVKAGNIFSGVHVRNHVRGAGKKCWLRLVFQVIP